MKSQLAICLFFLALSRVHAAEALLAVAPQIGVSSPNAVGYHEEFNNFYGTNAYLLKSPLLAGRVAKQFGGAPPAVVVNVDTIPKTSIFQVAVTGATEEQNQKYLDLLIQAFFDYKKQVREEIFKKRIDQIETAIQSTPEGALKDKLTTLLQEIKVAQICDDEDLRRIPER